MVTKANKRVELAKNQLTDLIQEFPKLSIGKAYSAIKLSFSCVRRFLKKDLHLKPYKVHEYHVRRSCEKGRLCGLITLYPTIGPNHDDRVR